MPTIVPLYRAPDWPAALHAACDQMEREQQASLDGKHNRYAGARAEFGAELLALDKIRRPEIYDMRQTINREYVLNVSEVQAALWEYLKKKDRPVPDAPEKLAVKWNGPGEAFIAFHEVLNFPETKET